MFKTKKNEGEILLMKCRLMNKHTQVALVEYNEDVQAITNIYEITNIEYAPLSFYNAYHNTSISDVKAMNQWFQGRGIPSWRKNLNHLLERLNISRPSELLNNLINIGLLKNAVVYNGKILISLHMILILRVFCKRP